MVSSEKDWGAVGIVAPETFSGVKLRVLSLPTRAHAFCTGALLDSNRFCPLNSSKGNL